MTNHDPGLTGPEPTITVKDVLWLLASCLVAGAIGGLIARYLTEVSMYVLLTLAAMGVLGPLLVLAGEPGLLLVCLVVSALIGGVLGLLLGELLRIVLCGPRPRLRSLPRFRVLLATPLWPLLALGSFFRFGDDVFLGNPQILPSLLLWPLGGVLVQVLAAVIALHHATALPEVATDSVGEQRSP